ncbi:M3 family metallopeptidase [Bacillus shivajii]|uniref:M3 family metallopeptidase n=1 Tax=Bacillus shivajii TaxID=1983719 RepID=UPI001CFBC1A4|nr:M3 family metallopeptidase [Bacillus shivajii]UCZ53610.1 M3 family metallopeptidase [Bacillus shivajii]
MKKLTTIAEELHNHQVQYSKLNWTLFTTGYDFGVQDEYLKMMDVLKDKENFETIEEYLEQDLSPLEQRKVEILHRSFKPYHLSDELNELNVKIQKKVNELSKILNTFRYKLDGKEVSAVELAQVLSMDSNRERRKEAFFARNQINQLMVDNGFIELINLRKEYAKLYGAENYVTYKLEANELDTTIFDSWLAELHDILPEMKEGRKKYAQEFLNDDEIMPWDEQYIQSQIAPSLNQDVDMSEYYTNIKDLFQMFGIDLTKMNITYDIFPRANKSEWGYNFPVETGKDSRILANVKNKYFEYGVLLHETGHGVHSFLLDPEEIILNKGVSGIISEGIANLFQGFLYSPAFYNKFFTDTDKVEQEFTRLKEYQKLNSLRSIGRIFFDHALYKNELNSLEDIYDVYWKNHKEVLGEEPFGEAPPWAYMIHFTTHPIYLHNYFMGDVTCAMLEQVFKEKYDTEILDKPEQFGEFLLNEVIKPSGTYKYNELFKRISGEDFSLKFMLDKK